MKHFRAALPALLALAATFAAPAQAGGSLDISLADDVVRLGYDATQMGSGLHVSFAGLHHEDDGDMLSAGLHVVDVRPSTSHMYIGVGAQAFVFSTDDYDGSALGVGGFFRYSFPAAPDVSLAGYAYYAPPVVSFMDAENMIVSDLRLQFSLLPTARIYAGYRYNSIRIEDIDKRYKLGDGAHFGLTIDF
ncbi:YfaZ family outer membrane protein [Thalassolituus sp. LLYu03]|uniref:YfaZ family outer membrane protein n=1 Tax=Thalassolituus sp. LLYu03 TaxID=3421656 RepID=UPI003D2C3544